MICDYCKKPLTIIGYINGKYLFKKCKCIKTNVYFQMKNKIKYS